MGTLDYFELYSCQQELLLQCYFANLLYRKIVLVQGRYRNVDFAVCYHDMAVHIAIYLSRYHLLPVGEIFLSREESLSTP